MAMAIRLNFVEQTIKHQGNLSQFLDDFIVIVVLEARYLE